MKKFLTFVTVAGIMILASGCEVHTRTVYVPKKGSTTVVQDDTCASNNRCGL
jgi:hypothetical protein